jgi:pimeloyl-ACP methyl ester carboxylesterase
MPTFVAHDGTNLAYRLEGSGTPVVCLPGGPMQDSAYLGDLGGLSAHRQLVLLDLRGTGRSSAPEDISTYRCDRLVDDVEALRDHLGLARMDLLGHSAGVNLALLYAARYPDNVGRLALITPSMFAVGISVTPQLRRAAAQQRRAEPWFAAAFAALDAITTGTGEDWEAITPFSYGRWDAAAQKHQAAENEQTNSEAAQVYGSDGAFDPATTRAALAVRDEPTLILAGQFDLGFPAALGPEYAGLFANGSLAVQPGAGHFPWLDDADRFVATTAAFLR